MKLKERLPDFLDPSAGEFVSPPAIFDEQRVIKARRLVEQLRLDKDLKALKIALTLAIYNYDVAGGEGVDLEQFTKRFSKLISEEARASDINNPLPTIGFEVECPRNPFDSRQDTPKYIGFFDTCGIPRNRIIQNYRFHDSSNWPNFWEFSPPPSYTAAVQNRILCELIKGRFIPSLRHSKDPADIFKYLDRKLISLHVNLGIPTYASGKIFNSWQTTHSGEGQQVPLDDLAILGTSFPLAFSSSLRLEMRTSLAYVSIKDADKTAKSGGAGGRVELKAMEVRDESVYRVIEEAQLLGAAFFACYYDRNLPISKIWQEAKSEILDIYDRFNVRSATLDDKKAMALVAQTQISRSLRRIIDRKAHEANRVISNNQVR